MNLAQDGSRPPTPSRIRVSANDSQTMQMQSEVQTLRARVRELEVENDKLKGKVNGASLDVINLQNEVSKMKSIEKELRFEIQRFEKQRQSLEAASEVLETINLVRREAQRLSNEIKKVDRNWKVAFV